MEMVLLTQRVLIMQSVLNWIEDNPNDEDRIGKFVTLDGNKIKIANAIDYVLGVVTANSSVRGNDPIIVSYGRSQRDIYGRVLKDFEGIPLQMDDYDATQPYVGKVNRKELARVGLLS